MSIILHNSEGILCNGQAEEGARSTHDIICMAQHATKKQERLLRDFSQLTHDHPEFFPQLTELMRARLVESNGGASVREAFERMEGGQSLVYAQRACDTDQPCAVVRPL